MGRQELKESVLIRGGKVRDKLDSLVSHIIAARLTESKLQTITKPCVKPEWITLSIKSNTLLPWRHYQLNPPKNSIISFVSGRKEESFVLNQSFKVHCNT